MAFDFFRIERGLELDELVQYLQGSGAPGVAGDTAAALVGSVYTDNSDGALYTKIAVGTGTDKWQKMASETYVNNAVGATVSWREPSLVRDNVATTLPTGTATQPIVIDGVSITNGGRVLFSAIVGGAGKNIYVYDQATGAFVEDVNAESDGDAVYVQSGTAGGKTFIFNGAAWVQSDQASLDELGYLRAFMGKAAAGNEMPDYTSNNFVSDATSLEAAVSSLDGALGPNVALGNYIDPAQTVNVNLQDLDTQLGANVSAGNHLNPANSTNANIQALDTQIGPELGAGNFISAAQATNSAITALDQEIGANVVNGNFVLASNKINANIQALDVAIGAPVVTAGVILAGNSANQNIQALAAELAATTSVVTVTNVTSVQTIDSIAGADAAKWLVRVELASDTTRVYATEVYALSDGTTADYTRYATLKLGTTIPGLAVTVDYVGGAMRLRAAATGAVNVTARRVGVMI